MLGNPTTTTAVAATKTTATTSMMKTNRLQNNRRKKKKKSLSTMKIKIKPFIKPPSLPPNFYQSSTTILYNSVRDILKNRQTNNISREELYNKVTDLCSHGFGPRLYIELISVLDDAALTCLSRLVENDDSQNSGNNHGNVNSNHSSGVGLVGPGGNIRYPTPHCRKQNNDNVSDSNNAIFFTSIQDIDIELNSTTSSHNTTAGIMSDQDNLILGNIWSVYSDYLQYLNCVQLIFQSLDRMFVYLPPTSSMTKAQVVPRNDGILGTATATTDASASAGELAGSSSSNNKNSAHLGISSNSGITIEAWNMWDVGINCMFQHMNLSHTNNNNNKKNATKDDSEDSIMDDCCTSTAAVVADGGSIAISESIITTNTTTQPKQTHYSTLQVLKQRSIACLIEELRMTSSSSSLSSLSSTTSSTTHSKEMLHHHPSIRNCVSIFRSFANIAAHPTNATTTTINAKTTTTTNNNTLNTRHTTQSKKNTKTNVMDDFLQDLVSNIASFLAKESQLYMMLDDSSSTNNIDLLPRKTSYDTRAVLHNVDSRLKQMAGMTSYYTLSTSSSSSLNSSKRDATRTTGTRTSRDGNRAGSSRNSNRILTHLVEMHLLSPHFNTKYLLHPANLYPILDDEDDVLTGDVKLIFQLSKRFHSTPTTNEISSTLGQKNFNTVPNAPGMELLRVAFQSYGKDRGMSIMSPTTVLPNKSVISSSVGGGGGAVKPPPAMTPRDIQNKIVSDLLRFKSHLEYLHKEAFGGEEYFGKTIKKVLEDVLNQGGEIRSSHRHDVMSTSDRRKKALSRHSGDGCDGGKRIAELLAKYIDLRFKKAKFNLTSTPMKSMRADSASNRDDDMDAFQNAALDLFRHIFSKDVFEAFYRLDLSKRLLVNKSVSIDNERSFVSKLKAECGTAYTSKMEGMFKDMELSRDVMGHYSSYLNSGSTDTKSSVDMEIKVLTTGNWPMQNRNPSLILPESLQSRKEHFESYYSSKYQGRRIAWQNSLGNCVVVAQFPKMDKPRELSVSLCQALVLKCFNIEEGSDEDPRYTINDIMKKTGMEDRDEAVTVLQSLTMGRAGTHVLRRVEAKAPTKDSDNTSSTPKNKPRSLRKAIADSDVFVFNADFFSNQRRIRITNIQMKETTEERSKTQESVTLDRMSLIDASIVRIMKARKTLDHLSLTGEVMKQLKFPASNTDIKKRIETLIEREYLERVIGDGSSYNYLA